jgi:predicted ribosome quality control (RQC) complex YloA/Tae2 family protein
MNALFIRKAAPAITAALAGKRLRYVLEAARPSGPVFLFRMEAPAGTLLVSLRPNLPCVARLEEGKSPEGKESAAAAKLARLLEGQALVRAYAPAVDRTLFLEWESGLATRIDLMRRPILRVLDASSVLLALPESEGKSGGGLPKTQGADRPDVLHFDPEALPAMIDDEESAQAAILGRVLFLPGDWAEEWFARARIAEAAPENRRPALVRAWRDLVDEHERSNRSYLYRSGGKLHLSTIAPRTADDSPETFADPIDATGAWWRMRDEEVLIEDSVREIRSNAAREQKRLRRLLEKQQAELRDAERAPIHRKQAEILSIHFGEIEKGVSEVVLPDPYEGGAITIALDPAKSARENIERLFRRAKKGERGAEIVGGRIAENERRVASLESILADLDGVRSEKEAEDLRARVGSLLRPEKREAPWREKIKKPKERSLPVRPREYTIAGGYTVLVGRDNKENDLLTFKIARPRDLWFHAAQAAGSHVVLLRDDPKKPVPREALLEAAAIAARHSKAKHAAKVPVIYTERRHVRKPKGWPPGKVTCAREKTLFVDPGIPGE